MTAAAMDGEPPAGTAADLAKPPVNEPREVEQFLMQTPQGNPLLLSHTLQELLSKDSVQVELIPEKKGLFLKHVEYEVSSKRFKCSVYRRYNDFVVFHEMLLQKFPYRMVPALPPKRVLGADREFIESRRRALKRFINLVARHPPFSEDVLLKLFLSFSGSDVQNKLRELVQGVGDEFVTCRLATQAKDFLPADIQAQFAASRELIRNIYNSFYKLRDRAERIASRAIDNASDLLIFGKELSALGSDTTPLPSWAALNNNTWGTLKQALKGLSVEFALLADKAVQQGKQEENDVVEKLNLFLDLLQSYKVSSAVLPARKLFRASLCSLEGVTPTGWKTVCEASSEANWASGRGRGVAVGHKELCSLPDSSSDDENLPKSKLCKEFKNMTG